ncbi:MAG: nitroreductase family protein [candidate division WOR-3 bacterium]|nr:MAG: nitroreductase family protein [candidate division WOR-3 bacterium]
MDKRIEALFARRSVRDFTGDEVDRADIRALLEAGMAAPSARGLDPWRFVVVTDRRLLDRLADVHPHAKTLKHAGACIAVCGDRAVAPDFWVQDCSAATENILVAAAMLGLGTCWLGVHPRAGREESLKKVLRVPDEVGMLCLIAVGRPKQLPEPRTRYDETKVREEQWT